MFPRSDAKTRRPPRRACDSCGRWATGKFIWPIPDKGLKKRIHRVKAPTLLVWGREDRWSGGLRRRVHAAYSGARVQMIDSAGTRRISSRPRPWFASFGIFSLSNGARGADRGQAQRRFYKLARSGGRRLHFRAVLLRDVQPIGPVHDALRIGQR
jgi:hypothetical protein